MSGTTKLLHGAIAFVILWCNINVAHSSKDETYFQDALISNGTFMLDNMRELSCNIALTGEINKTHDIHYYEIHLTQEMIEIYPAYLTITTCCKIANNTMEQMYLPTFWYIYNNTQWDDYNDSESLFYLWCDYCGCDPKTLLFLDSNYTQNHSDYHNPNVTIDDIPFFDGYGCGEPHLCNNHSLDTILYVMSEKKGIITLLETGDDTSSDVCSNKEKSMIDLSSYAADEKYIVAVGGFGDELGEYQIDLECVQFSRPIENEQINPKRSDLENKTLSCGSTFKNEENSLQQLVSYYTFSITENINYPVIITTCDENHGSAFRNILYLVQQYNIANVYWEYSILNMSAYSFLCDDAIASDIIIESLDQYTSGEYLIIVQNYWINHVNRFSISVHCAADEVHLDYTLYIVLSLFLLFVIVAFIIYFRIKFRFFREQSKKFNVFLTNYELDAHLNALKPQIRLLQEIDHLDDAELLEISEICGLPQDDTKKFIDACNAYQNGEYRTETDSDDLFSPLSGRQSQDVTEIEFIPLKNIDTDDNIDDEDVKELSNLCSAEPLIEVRTKSRRIPFDETHANLRVTADEDRIQRGIAHALSICDDHDGSLDVYQVLAMRCMDPHSFEPSIGYPFKSCVCNCPRKLRYKPFMHIAPVHRTMCTAFVVLLLQTIGITVTVVMLIIGHFGEYDDINDYAACSMARSHWTQTRVIFNKLFAFFWSLYISFSIANKMRNTKDSGFDKIFRVLQHEEVHTISCVNFVGIQLGQIVNYYTYFVAVIGSFFIIYDTNSEDIGSSGIEMILNALALFFMLDIDNELVYTADYEDGKKIWLKFDRKYRKHKQQGTLSTLALDIETHPCPKTYELCRNCCQKYQVADTYGSFVFVLLYTIGAIAPFAIFMCW